MDCIRRAYEAYQRNEITHTGSMVHYVDEGIDTGKVISTIEIPIYDNDTYEDLETRQKRAEKGLLISAIQQLVNENYSTITNELIAVKNNKVYQGKVRRVEDLENGLLLLSTSDRLSAYDHHICNVPGKGVVLNNLSAWWFNKLRNIIPNHYLYHQGKNMIGRKTDVIPLEIVVRGFMTGSSKTSIWTMYSEGQRDMYGMTFRDGYSKNERLDNVIITPTTKGVIDKPITADEIVSEGILTTDEWEFISSKALELFREGQRISAERGYLLVDTKYEFGRLPTGEIILIDELHTCDSSRFWKADTYEERLAGGLEPEKLDKDCIRDWLSKNFDVKSGQFPQSEDDIPQEVITRVSNTYTGFYNSLTGNEINTYSDIRDTFLNHYYSEYHHELVVILAGSTSDKPHCAKIANALKDQGIISVEHYSSAHKNTAVVLGLLNRYNNSTTISGNKRHIVFVTVAGRSNALSGVTACNTQFPVFACPPFKDKSDMMVNINSTLQMPSKTPVMTVLEPANVALAIRKIFNLVN